MKKYSLYLLAGIFGLCLMVSCNLEEIPPLDPPVASFSVENDSCLAVCTLSFTNTSQHGNQYLWDFGDGSPLDTTRNPTHEYQDQGTFQVRLITTLLTSSDTAEREVTILPTNFNKPAADFTVDKDSCKAPCLVTFLNQSQKGESYFWDFGDGNTSTDSDPSHTYEKPGTYTVMLVAYGAGMTDTIYQTLKIQQITFLKVFQNGLGPANDVIELEGGGFAVVGNGGFLAKIFPDGTVAWDKYGTSNIVHFDAIIQSQEGNLGIISNLRDTINYTYAHPSLIEYTLLGGQIGVSSLLPTSSLIKGAVSDIALSKTGDYLIVGGGDGGYTGPTTDDRIVLIQKPPLGPKFYDYFADGFSANGGEVYHTPNHGTSFFGYVHNATVPTLSTHFYTIKGADTTWTQLSKNISRFAPTRDGSFITLISHLSMELWKLIPPSSWSLGVSIPINDSNYDRIEAMKIIERIDTAGYAGVANVYLKNNNPNISPKYSGLFFITDSIGSVIHREIIGQPQTYDGLYSIIPTSDCGYAIAGMLDGKPILIKTDAVGNY